LVIPLFGPALLQQSQVPPYAYLLFLNNYWTASGLRAFAPLGPFWSLAIEEQFYLIAPAFILSVTPRARNATLLVVVLISPILRLCDLHFSPWDFTAFRLDGFSVGMLIAVLLREPRFSAFAPRNLATINATCIALIVAALAFSIYPEFSLRQRVAFGITLNSLAAGAAILMLHLNPNGLLSRTLSRAWLVALGRVSYFMYVMHLPILMCMAMLPAPKVLKPLLAFGICVIYAWGSWRYLESRLISFGKRFQYRRSVLTGSANQLQRL
jgi:peptidoglycan/LPS O-acetylase OafA/YrhL